MTSIEYKLLLGYIFSREYLGDFEDEKRYKYAHSQAVIYLASGYAFHISGVCTFLLKLNGLETSDTLLFVVLMCVFLTSSWLLRRRLELKFPSSEALKKELLSANIVFKKRTIRRSSWFFISQIALWLVYIFLIFYL